MFLYFIFIEILSIQFIAIETCNNNYAVHDKKNTFKLHVFLKMFIKFSRFHFH